MACCGTSSQRMWTSRRLVNIFSRRAEIFRLPNISLPSNSMLTGILVCPSVSKWCSAAPSFVAPIWPIGSVKMPSRQMPRTVGVFLHTILSLLSAVLLLLIFPKFDLRFLAPVALTPLLVALARTEYSWERFAYGWAAGLFYWFFLCTWIQ